MTTDLDKFDENENANTIAIPKTTIDKINSFDRSSINSSFFNNTKNIRFI